MTVLLAMIAAAGVQDAPPQPKEWVTASIPAVAPILPGSISFLCQVMGSGTKPLATSGAKSETALSSVFEGDFTAEATPLHHHIYIDANGLDQGQLRIASGKTPSDEEAPDFATLHRTAVPYRITVRDGDNVEFVPQDGKGGPVLGRLSRNPATFGPELRVFDYGARTVRGERRMVATQTVAGCVRIEWRPADGN